MSVIPQEDNLVMDFATATRIFNQDQSNAGSFIPGTGDATQQQPIGVIQQQSYNSGLQAINPNVMPSRENSGSFRRSGEMGRDGLHRPISKTEGIPAVVPAMIPSQQEVLMNPNRMVEIRNPRQDNMILEEEEHYANPWFSTRQRLRVYFAEFLGTMILVLWGEGTQAQVVAARNAPNDYLSIAWGWGVGFMLAIYVSSGISGGHINPAVTISLAVFRKFPWRRVPGYILAQLLGAFAAAAVIYGVYYGPLNALEGGYAGVLTTGPAALVPSVAGTFFSVFTGAALLMGAIAAFTDTGNNPATPGLTPLLLGLIMVGIASSFGYQTGFVLNPARDLGPRLLVWATGVSGRQLWLDNSAYGIWTPAAAATSGALFGNLLYDLLIYNGRESPVNWNLSPHRHTHKKNLEERARLRQEMIDNAQQQQQQQSVGAEKGFSSGVVDDGFSGATLRDREGFNGKAV